MGLEIAKIQNGVLQGIANQADENKDGVIRGASELNVFEEAAKNAVNEELVSKEDFKSTLDLFEIEYPSENQVLRNLAIESDEDKSEKLLGKELDNYIEKGKKAVNSELATDEELENTTDGFYQKKTTMQKVGRGFLVGLGAIAGLALGGCIGSKIADKISQKFINTVSQKCNEWGCYTKTTKFALAEVNGNHFSKLRLTKLGYISVLSTLIGTAALGATAGGVAVAKMTESNR